MLNNQTPIADNEQNISNLMQKIQATPNDMQNYYQLGCLLKSLGRFEDAKKTYTRILQKNLSDVNTLFDMAFACHHLDQFDEAIIWYQKLLQIDPSHLQALINMGHIYRILGDIQQACHFFRIAGARINPGGFEVLCHIALPVVFQSRNEILYYRKRLTDFITNHHVRIDDPLAHVGITNFLLAYHDLDDTRIQQSIANFYYRSCPVLNYMSPYIHQPKCREKITIGFATSYFLEYHPVGKVFEGLIKYLDREQFRVVLLHSSGRNIVHSRLHKEYKNEIQYIPNNLPQCHEIISKEKLDILFYPEIGMEPLFYFLAFSRLANVQCAGWGHPVTSGIQNIDYYISSTDMEPENGMMHYTEKLVMLKTFISCFFRPKLKNPHLNRSDFNLPDGHWYVCPQNIQKLHPDMDLIFSKILKNDPKGRLILYANKYPIFMEQLKKRMMNTMSGLLHRVHFVNRMSLDKFLNFLYLCDSVIDVPFFSSGTTTLEAISAGIPIVTLPGKYFRNRLAYGCFKRINVLDTVARDLNNFVLLANQLACDQNFRKHVSQKILLNNDQLFDNQDTVRAYENFFIHIVQKSQKVQMP